MCLSPPPSLLFFLLPGITRLFHGTDGGTKQALGWVKFHDDNEQFHPWEAIEGSNVGSSSTKTLDSPPLTQGLSKKSLGCLREVETTGRRGEDAQIFQISLETLTSLGCQPVEAQSHCQSACRTG